MSRVCDEGWISINTDMLTIQANLEERQEVENGSWQARLAFMSQCDYKQSQIAHDSKI
jgi:hypothetical protein